MVSISLSVPLPSSASTPTERTSPTSSSPLSKSSNSSSPRELKFVSLPRTLSDPTSSTSSPSTVPSTRSVSTVSVSPIPSVVPTLVKFTNSFELFEVSYLAISNATSTMIPDAVRSHGLFAQPLRRELNSSALLSFSCRQRFLCSRGRCHSHRHFRSRYRRAKWYHDSWWFDCSYGELPRFLYHIFDEKLIISPHLVRCGP